MWLLLLVLVPAIPGFDRTTVLETLATEQACLDLRQTVLEGMVAAYPDDYTYSVECRFKPTRS